MVSSRTSRTDAAALRDERLSWNHQTGYTRSRRHHDRHYSLHHVTAGHIHSLCFLLVGHTGPHAGLRSGLHGGLGPLFPKSRCILERGFPGIGVAQEGRSSLGRGRVEYSNTFVLDWLRNSTVGSHFDSFSLAGGDWVIFRIESPGTIVSLANSHCH